MKNANKKSRYTNSYNLHYGEWMVTFSFLVQLNTNRVSVLSILLAVVMVNYAVAILLTADSSGLLWGYPRSCPHSSLLLRSL